MKLNFIQPQRTTGNTLSVDVRGILCLTKSISELLKAKKGGSVLIGFDEDEKPQKTIYIRVCEDKQPGAFTLRTGSSSSFMINLKPALDILKIPFETEKIKFSVTIISHEGLEFGKLERIKNDTI